MFVPNFEKERCEIYCQYSISHIRPSHYYHYCMSSTYWRRRRGFCVV